MRYVTVDQIWVWALFCFLGMYLNVNLAVGIIPHGTSLSGLGTGAYQAQYMAEKLWSGFWFLTLLNGFWILFSTQLGNTDILARTITDVSWLSSAKVRGWRGGDVRGVYYTALFVVSAWAIATLWLGRALSMFTILANMAGAGARAGRIPGADRESTVPAACAAAAALARSVPRRLRALLYVLFGAVDLVDAAAPAIRQALRGVTRRGAAATSTSRPRTRIGRSEIATMAISTHTKLSCTNLLLPKA
jgi:hypothetical protein